MKLVSVALLLAIAMSVEPSVPPPAPGADKELTRSVRRIADRWVQLRAERFDRHPAAIRSPAVMAEIAATARAFAVVNSRRLEARGRAWNDLGLGGPGSPSLVWLALAQDLDGIDLDAQGARLLVSPLRLTAADYGVQTHELELVPDGAGGMRELHPRDDATDPLQREAGSAGEFLLATGVRPDEPLLAHYLTHLRQLERSGEDSIRETTDALLAASAWSEGEANLVALYFLFSGVGLARTVLTGAVGPGEFLDGQLIPAAVSEFSPAESKLLNFVYEDGYDFAILHWKRSGWSVFDAPPPQTTRQLIHAVGPGPPVVWSEPVEPDEGYRLVDTDRLGEQAIGSMLSIWSADEGHSFRAAEGWIGDRLLRWERSPADGVTVWESVWSGEADAAEFLAAFVAATRRRFPDASVDASATGARRIETRHRRFILSRAGKRVRIEVLPSEPAQP